MALLNPAATLPTSTRDAQEMFDERYNAAQLLVQPQTWVSELGEEHATPALETKYPMSVLALKFTETKAGEGKFKTIGEKDCTLTTAEYDEGVEIELVKLCSNSFAAKRWADAPAGFVQAEQMFKLKLIADALVANAAGACGWDDLALFHDSHLCDPKNGSSSTFDNLQGTTKDVADLSDLEEEITLMANVLDVNGDRLGVMPTHIGVPTAKFQKLKNLLKQDFVPNSGGTATMRNPYNDAGLTVVRMDQLTDDDDWYLFDMNIISKGVPPWIISKLALPGPGFSELGIRHWDMSNSDACRAKGTLAVSQHIFYGYKFLYPHAIRKIAGA
jgi:hypothetical protein